MHCLGSCHRTPAAPVLQVATSWLTARSPFALRFLPPPPPWRLCLQGYLRKKMDEQFQEQQAELLAKIAQLEVTKQ